MCTSRESVEVGVSDLPSGPEVVIRLAEGTPITIGTASTSSGRWGPSGRERTRNLAALILSSAFAFCAILIVIGALVGKFEGAVALTVVSALGAAAAAAAWWHGSGRGTPGV